MPDNGPDRTEPFDAFVRRVAPEHAVLILFEHERLEEDLRQASFLFGVLGHDGQHENCDPCAFVHRHPIAKEEW